LKTAQSRTPPRIQCTNWSWFIDELSTPLLAGTTQGGDGCWKFAQTDAGTGKSARIGATTESKIPRKRVIEKDAALVR